MKQMQHTFPPGRMANHNSSSHKKMIPANPATLQFCWHIRVGMFRNVDPCTLKAYADFFYTTYLDRHLKAQEDLLQRHNDLPVWITKNVLASQRRLRRLFESPKDVYRSLSQIEDTLERHVRLEQKILFGALLQLASDTAGEEKLYRSFYHAVPAKKLELWKDRFWSLD